MEAVTDIIPLILQVLGALVVFATALAQLSPNPSHMARVDSVAAKLFKLISYLPTLGINPRTKKLEEAYDEIKRKNG